MGTYCEEEHRRTIKKLGVGGKISKSAFTSWYIDWLFGDGEDSEYEEEEDENEVDGKDEAGIKKDDRGSSSWGDLFKVDGNKWKCEFCFVYNNEGTHKCAACGSVRVGYEDKAKAEEKEE